jgi:hypothetical protein
MENPPFVDHLTQFGTKNPCISVAILDYLTVIYYGFIGGSPTNLRELNQARYKSDQRSHVQIGPGEWEELASSGDSTSSGILRIRS